MVRTVPSVCKVILRRPRTGLRNYLALIRSRRFAECSSVPAPRGSSRGDRSVHHATQEGLELSARPHQRHGWFARRSALWPAHSAPPSLLASGLDDGPGNCCISNAGNLPGGKLPRGQSRLRISILAYKSNRVCRIVTAGSPGCLLRELRSTKPTEEARLT